MGAMESYSVSFWRKARWAQRRRNHTDFHQSKTRRPDGGTSYRSRSVLAHSLLGL